MQGSLINWQMFTTINYNDKLDETPDLFTTSFASGGEPWHRCGVLIADSLSVHVVSVLVWYTVQLGEIINYHDGSGDSLRSLKTIRPFSDSVIGAIICQSVLYINVLSYNVACVCTVDTLAWSWLFEADSVFSLDCKISSFWPHTCHFSWQYPFPGMRVTPVVVNQIFVSLHARNGATR